MSRRQLVLLLLLGLAGARGAGGAPGVLRGQSAPSAATAPSGPTPAEYAEHWRAVQRAVLDGTAEQQGLLQEGDLLVLPAGAAGLRNADADPGSLWPQRRVVLELAQGEWPRPDLELLLEALRDIESESCVRFSLRANETDYLLLRHAGHSCASIVGFHVGAGGIPTFLGGPGCLRRGTIQHELLHTLGLWHEHTRPDRDQHVAILWEHIQPGWEPNFYKKPPGSVRTLGLPYDYGSVMHYRALAFSRDGHPTILPKIKEAVALIGQRRRFSRLDIAKLNTLYDCPSSYYRGESESKPEPSETPIKVLS